MLIFLHKGFSLEPMRSSSKLSEMAQQMGAESLGFNFGGCAIRSTYPQQEKRRLENLQLLPTFTISKGGCDHWARMMALEQHQNTESR